MRIEKVLSRSTTDGDHSMWGSLHVSRPDGKVVGWLVDSWGIESRPRMNWVSREDEKFYRVDLSLEPTTSISLGEEDPYIEPHRAEFIKEAIGKWEQEWIKQQRLTCRST